MKTDVLIVGAGFAGASTAFHLSRCFKGSILIIDQETLPGYHASGRNASLLLQSVENPELREILAASRENYEAHSQRIGFSPCGSILLGSEAVLERQRSPERIPSSYLKPEEVYRRCPLLKGHSFAAALWTPSDGVIDISALLQFYLQEATSKGVELLLDCRLEAVLPDDTVRVETSRGLIESRTVVNAAGAWADQVGRQVRGAPQPMKPYKRHLFVLDEVGPVDSDWPFIWSLAENFYFRPESGGILFSICDEQICNSLEPTVEPEMWENLAEFIHQQLPQLEDAVQRKVWSCFRMKTSSGLFHIGWDAVRPELFHVAGLGGHGMGSSWEVGRLAAQALLERL